MAGMDKLSFRPRRSAPLAALATALLSFLSPPLIADARAQDRFEIQVYDSEVAEAGEAGLELHSNFTFKGSKVTSPEGELPTQQVLRLTLEPHLGVFGWGEIGGYFQTAVRPEGSLDFAGFKLRFKAKWPEKLLGGVVGLSVNAELSRVPAAYEANVWATELRPAIDARLGRFYASFNPIIATDLQGTLAGHPQFEPAGKVTFFILPALSVGAEYYAAFGPIDSFLPLGEQSHRGYAIVDFSTEHLDLNAGLGRGWGTAEPWVAKMIFGIHPKSAVVERPGEAAGHAAR